MKKLLWIGDAACPSGFAQSTHKILETLRLHYDVTVLGLNYRGDPHSYPYPIYAAMAEGDAFGIGRLIWMCDLVKPDVIVLQNDGWNIPHYVQQLQKFPEYATVPVAAIVAVDGKNFNGRWLDGISLSVFWTQFALDEARTGGYKGPAAVIPLGVDLSVYHPTDKREAKRNRLGEKFADAFIVGNVNRNQPRKRWDLTVKYFAEWVLSKKIDDAYLYLHTAPTGDVGVDVMTLMKYYGVIERLILMTPPTHYGISEDSMRATYNCFDVQVSTTQGEGFGLTTFEGMACRTPQILPDWSALGELCRGAAWLVPCTSTCIGQPYVNVIGGVADQERFTQALQALYANPEYRVQNGQAAIERAGESRFRWENIGQSFVDAIGQLFARLEAPKPGPGSAVADNQTDGKASPLPTGKPATAAEWADLGRPEEVPA